MKKRMMGTRGFQCSALGYGAMSLAGIYGNASKEESFAILDACLESGVDHIDTANVYTHGEWRSENLIGEWFEARGADVRDRFTIATKASITKDPDTGERSFSNAREHLESELDQSLKRLGVDAVDLFYIHRRDTRFSVEELGATLSDLVKTGKCKGVGISEVAPSIARRLSEYCPLIAVQSEYSLSTRSPELGLVQGTRDIGAALVAFSPVGRGLLTDTPPTQVYIDNSVFLRVNPRFNKENFQLNLAETDRFRALAAEFAEPAAALAIAWLLAQGDHVIPIPGTRNVEHLREAVRGTELSLSTSDLQAIENVLPVGWAHGDRYAVGQWVGPERYC